MYLSFPLAPSPVPPGTTFIKQVAALLDSNTMVTVTGHSLGAALATPLALDLAAHSTFPLSVYTLASPRVGDLTFHHLFNHVVPNAYRIHNRLDIVTQTPPPILYFHVGDETELVPNKKLLKFTLACEHHLTTYLNLLAILIGTVQVSARLRRLKECSFRKCAGPSVSASRYAKDAQKSALSYPAKAIHATRRIDPDLSGARGSVNVQENQHALARCLCTSH